MHTTQLLPKDKSQRVGIIWKKLQNAVCYSNLPYIVFFLELLLHIYFSVFSFQMKLPVTEVLLQVLAIPTSNEIRPRILMDF